MTYAMADIHGDYERYIKMLEKIRFNDEDQLYVIGDVVDRGKGGIRILQDMMLRVNVIPILGNHEYMMAQCARFLLQEVTEETISAFNADTMQGFTEWMNVGGSPTIEALHKLDQEDRESIIEYLEEFTLFEEVQTAGKDFVLVHAGLVNFAEDRDLESYEPFELLFKPPCYDRVYFQDKYLVTGHLPTRVIWAQEQGFLTSELDRSQYRDVIYNKNHHIAIDCGCGYDGRLGCICLETFEEYYV